MTNTVTLIDGTPVDSSSEAWRLECLQRHRHVETMRRIDLQGRRDYLAKVAHSECEEAAARLKDAYLSDRDRRAQAAQELCG